MASLSDFISSLTFKEWVQMFGSRENPAVRERTMFDPWAGQLDFLDWMEGRKEIWAPKARQLGLSEIAGERLVKSSIELPRGEFVVISKTAEDAEYFLDTRVVPKLKNLPDLDGIQWPTVEKKTVDRVLLSNGSYIKSLPAVSASGAGRTLNGFVLDEFGGVDSQPHCKGSQLYKNLKPTIEKSGGWGMIIGTSEPNSFFNAQLWKQWKGEADPMYYFLSWKTDPSRTIEWYKRALKEYETEADFRNQFPADMGEFFATREGRVFPSFDYQTGGRHVRYFEPNWDMQYFIAYDHGFKHYAAALHFLYDPYDDMLFLVGEQFWRGIEVHAIARELRDRETQYARIPTTRLADIQIFNKDGRRSVADHFRQEGILFKPAWKADEAGSRALLADRFSKGKLLIHPDCKNSITQLINYVWKPNGTGEKPIDKDDEAPDCLRYVCAHLHKKDRPMEKVGVAGRKEYVPTTRTRLSSFDTPSKKHWQAM